MKETRSTRFSISHQNHFHNLVHWDINILYVLPKTVCTLFPDSVAKKSKTHCNDELSLSIVLNKFPWVNKRTQLHVEGNEIT